MPDLSRFRNIHKGKTCVVIGNGPSLDKTPLDFPCVTFASNKIYRLPFEPEFYCIVDEKMAKNCLPLPDNFRPTEMFIRAECGVGNPIYPVVLNGFSVDISNFVVMGGTVTFAMLQIAYYMGFQKVLLVGVDHNYPQASQGRPGSAFTAGNEDPDHFTCADGKPYFDTGKAFNRPELEGVNIFYRLAREVFEKDGRQIINLTPDTKTDAFEKGTW